MFYCLLFQVEVLERTGKGNGEVIILSFWRWYTKRFLIKVFFSYICEARDENFKANFAQYGLSSYFVDVLVADAGRLGLREAPLFDAIITDRK